MTYSKEKVMCEGSDEVYEAYVSKEDTYSFGYNPYFTIAEMQRLIKELQEDAGYEFLTQGENYTLLDGDHKFVISLESKEGIREPVYVGFDQVGWSWSITKD